MISIGLILLALIQLTTALTILIKPSQSESFGIAPLNHQQRIYRYLLGSLWLSVTCIYVLGTFESEFRKGALILGIMNVFLEVLSYWIGFRDNRKTKSFPIWGTMAMGIPGIICVIELLNQ